MINVSARIMDKIICKKPKVEDGNKLIHVFEPKGRTKRYFQTNKLEVKYPVDISNIQDSLLTVPLLSNLAPVAWITGNTLHINQLDERTARTIQLVKLGYKQTLNQAGFDVGLLGETLINNTARYGGGIVNDRKKAMLFTGGVDSTASYLRRQGEAPALIVIKREKDSKDLWNSRKRNIEAFADYFNTDYHVVESNMRKNLINGSEILLHSSLNLSRSWWAGIQYPIGYMGLLAPLAEAEGFSALYQSSGATGKSLFHAPEANPMTVDQLVWGNTESRIVDFGLSRQDKVETIVSKYSSDWPFIIHSCSDPTPCTSCESCYRNIMGIFTAGGNPESLGYEVNGRCKKLIEYFDTEIVTFSPVKVNIWENIQSRLDREIWTGPPQLYEAFSSVSIQSREKQQSLKRKVYWRLPQPVDRMALRVYRAVQSKS